VLSREATNAKYNLWFEPTFYRTRGEQEEPVFIFIIIHYEVSIYNLHNLRMIGKQTVSTLMLFFTQGFQKYA